MDGPEKQLSAKHPSNIVLSGQGKTLPSEATNSFSTRWFKQ
jgi:hypothetical protein